LSSCLSLPLIRSSPPIAIPLFPPSACHPPAPHSFPTRRSSDLDHARVPARHAPGRPHPPGPGGLLPEPRDLRLVELGLDLRTRPDRKSTRLNSSHVEISYAVFCLKKKKKKKMSTILNVNENMGT